MCPVSAYYREPHRPYPLEAHHPMEKTDIKSVMEILIPKVQSASSGLEGFMWVWSIRSLFLMPHSLLVAKPRLDFKSPYGHAVISSLYFFAVI